MSKPWFGRGWLSAAALAWISFGGAGFTRAAVIPVTVDTSAFAGMSGRFEFDLFDGDGVANNTVTISNIVTDGTLGAVDCSIGCSGGPAYVLSDSLGFGSLLQDLILGSTFSFVANYTNNFGSGPPDQFVFFLLNPATNFSLIDTSLDSPYGDALALATLDGTGNIQTADAGVTIGAVPEPATALLVAVFLPLLLLKKRLLNRSNL
jgi:hypothetical protein